MASFLRWFRFIGIPTVGLLYWGSLLILYPDVPEQGAAMMWTDQQTFIALLFAVGFAVVVFESGIWLSRLLGRHLSWSRHPLRRVLLQTGLQTLLAQVLTLAFALAFIRFVLPPDEQPVRLVDLLPLLLIGFFTALLLSGVYIGASFFSSWRAETLAKEQAEAQAAQAQLRTLQQQLDPHFLFNTLNTLTAIIEDDPPRAVTYVQRLATVYRYVLQHRHATQVRLREELTLAAAYLYLLQIRYASGLQVSVEVPAELQQRHVLPLVLQLLLENAVKHNRIDADEPLRIRIYAADGLLTVENNRQPQARPAASEGVGLLNISRRYESVTGQRVQVHRSEALFRVSVPLLP